MTTVKNRTIPEFLRELELAQKELVEEFRTVKEAELRVPPAEGEWSFLDAAQHVAPVYRFWIIWIHKVRGSLQAMRLVGTPPLTKTVYSFRHPERQGVVIQPLRECLDDLQQATEEVAELLGWVSQEEYAMVVPPFTEEEHAKLIEGPAGHYYNLALPPTVQPNQGMNRLLEYAGGFSIQGCCGHILEGHTRNHVRQMAAARQAAVARVAR